MRVALLINEDNFKNYSAPGLVPADWELIQLGNGPIDEEKTAATGADALFVDAVTPVTAKLISAMPNLKLIHSQGVAFNMIDLEAARSAGVYVCNNAGVNALAVAEQTVLLILALLKRFSFNERMTLAGRQAEAKGKCFASCLPELCGKRVGLVGFGAIARETAKRLGAFGCKISYYRASGRYDGEAEYSAAYKPLDQLLSDSDIISLHLPVKPETLNMIDGAAIAKMKNGAILINTARGEIVDQDAVCAALISGKLGGFGADTLAPEPVTADNPILKLPESVLGRVALSPHVAGLTAGSFMRTYENVWMNMRAVAAGERPGNIVNGL